MVILILFLLSKTRNYVFLFCNFISKRQPKTINYLSKGSERSVYWSEYLTKSGRKHMTNEYRYFLKLNFVGVNRLFVLVDSNQEDANSKRFKT